MIDPTLVWAASAGAGSALVGVVGMVRRSATRDRAAEHPMRRDILSSLERRPGLSISRLCDEVGSGWGTVQHHLYVLKRAGLVRGLTRGRSHRLFSTASGPRPPLDQLALLRRGRVLDLVREVVEEPGIAQHTITERARMSRKVLRGYANLLKGAGLIEEVARSKYRYYYPTPALTEFLENPQVALLLEDRARPPAPGDSRLE